MFGFKAKNEMLFLLIAFVVLNLVLMTGGGFLKALVFCILMVLYGILCIAQATMETGETSRGSMIDVKEFGTQFIQKLKSDRKRCFEYSMGKSQRGCSKGENACA